jgi:hypothetical protein
MVFYWAVLFKRNIFMSKENVNNSFSPIHISQTTKVKDVITLLEDNGEDSLEFSSNKQFVGTEYISIPLNELKSVNSEQEISDLICENYDTEYGKPDGNGYGTWSGYGLEPSFDDDYYDFSYTTDVINKRRTPLLDKCLSHCENNSGSMYLEREVTDQQSYHIEMDEIKKLKQEFVENPYCDEHEFLNKYFDRGECDTTDKGQGCWEGNIPDNGTPNFKFD